ncbi:hypothetical protein [Ruminococcus sp. zg-924]|uniref:hypothetical protein n=1 Tax=Ruminococcus sp. zg-924 TaxID=2678505 RepID=UPI00210A4715|nr:hypothetical protein [Ruminococcus sp. zg-924]MCQ4022820.1 hypothetical protein [Ruminococcus sp. zg-924]
MKELVCNYCGGKWFVEDESINNVNTCPFCSKLIRTKIELNNVTVDTFPKALCNAINYYGPDVLSTPSKLNSYIMDTTPQYKKDAHILYKALSSESARILKNIDQLDKMQLKEKIDRFGHQLLDNEGLSEDWVNKICEAISFSFSKIETTIISHAQVRDVQEFNTVTKKKEDSLKKKKLTSGDYIDVSNVHEWWAEESMVNGIRFFNNKDLDNALVQFLHVANMGYVPAFNYVAKVYYCKQNYKKAWKWYKKSADQKDSEGEYFTAFFFENGLHVQKDFTSAFIYYNKSAKQGYKQAEDKIEELKRSMTFEEKLKYGL